eukprot:Gb_35834 [translate_table: standard]
MDGSIEVIIAQSTGLAEVQVVALTNRAALEWIKPLTGGLILVDERLFVFVENDFEVQRMAVAKRIVNGSLLAVNILPGTTLERPRPRKCLIKIELPSAPQKFIDHLSWAEA